MKILGLLLPLMLLSCQCGKFLKTKELGSVENLIGQNHQQYLIDSDDKITVSIWNNDDISVGSLYTIYSANEVFGRWVQVDSVGYARLPKIGTFYMKGLTCTQAADSIAEFLSKEVKDPIVVIRVLNREITIIGEVRTPGNFILEKEQTTLYEWLGKAEGFTQYANTKKVQLVRDSTSYIIDLSKQNALALHAVSVYSGDVVNVPSKSGKGFDMSIGRIIPFASAFTAIAVLWSVF